MRRSKQPTRVELAEHIDSLVQTLVDIRSISDAEVATLAGFALKDHAAWVKKSFL